MSYNTGAPTRRGYESSPVLTAPALDESWTRLLPNPPPPPFDPVLAQMLSDQAHFMGDSVYQLFYSDDPGLGPVPDEPGWQGGAGMTSPGAESSASYYDSLFSPAPSQGYTDTPMTEYSPDEFPSSPTYSPAHSTPAHATFGPSGSYAPTHNMEAPFSDYMTPITPSSMHAPTTTGPVLVPVAKPRPAFIWRCTVPGCETGVQPTSLDTFPIGYQLNMLR